MLKSLTKPKQTVEEEALLIEQAKANPQKFEGLYNRYYEPIFRFVYQRLDAKETTADITSQVFLKALSNLGKYVSRGVPFSAWLYRIALNEINNYYSRSQQQRVVNIDSSKALEIIDEMEQEKSDEQIALLYNSLATLGNDDLLLLEMRFFESRSFKEIGDILNITENNAKVRLYRVIDKLKQKFGTLPTKKNAI